MEKQTILMNDEISDKIKFIPKKITITTKIDKKNTNISDLKRKSDPIERLKYFNLDWNKDEINKILSDF